MGQAIDVAAVLEHTEWVRALARRLVADHAAAEDVAQDSLAAALRARIAPQNLAGWLASVVRTNALRWRRREAARGGVERTVARGETLPSTAELVERADTERRLVEIVLALDEPHRRTLLLRYFEGLTPAEMAAREGVPLATVTSRITRAHDQVRERATKLHGAWFTFLAPFASPPRIAALPGGALPMFKLVFVSASLVVLALASVFGWQRAHERDSRGLAHEDARLASSSATPRPTPDAPADVERAPALTRAPAAPAVDRTRVRGRVVDAAGRPVADARVGTGAAELFSFLDGGRTVPPSFVTTRSDDAGRFEFEDVDAGALTLSANDAEHAPSLALVLAPGRQRDDVTLTLRDGGALHVRVLRTDGRPAARREIAFMYEPEMLVKLARTDAEGSIEQRGLVPGEWLVSTMPGEDELKELGDTDTSAMHRMTMLARKNASVRAGARTELVLGGSRADTVRVTGHVSHGGKGCASLLNWFAAGGRQLEKLVGTQSTADGAYGVDVAPGRWLVVVSETQGAVPSKVERIVEVTKDAAPVIDFALPSSAIAGRVLDATGGPVAGAHVTLVAERAQSFRNDVSPGHDIATTDADGRFTVAGLDTGRYALTASVGGKDASRWLGAARLDGIVVPENDARVEVELRLGGAGVRVTGRVRDVRGVAVTGAHVFVFDANGRALDPLSGSRSERDGSWASVPVGIGRCSVVATLGGLVSDAVAIDMATRPGPVELVLREGATLVVPRPRANEFANALPVVRVAGGLSVAGLRSLASASSAWSGDLDPDAWRFKALPAGRVEVVFETADGEKRSRTLELVPGDEHTLAIE